MKNYKPDKKIKKEKKPEPEISKKKPDIKEGITEIDLHSWYNLYVLNFLIMSNFSSSYYYSVPNSSIIVKKKRFLMMERRLSLLNVS
jgi:hypothetical protein